MRAIRYLLLSIKLSLGHEIFNEVARPRGEQRRRDVALRDCEDVGRCAQAKVVDQRRDVANVLRTRGKDFHREQVVWIDRVQPQAGILGP